MALPTALHIVDQAASPVAVSHGPDEPDGGMAEAATAHPGTAILVHGSLDRADSFRRVMRRLGDLRVIAYDRRGYARSRTAGPAADLSDHVADLLAVAEAAGPRPVAAVGHSFGGDVVIAAALARPDLFDAVAAYEPPMPWLGFRRPPSGDRSPGWAALGDPAEEAERFFRRMVGDAVWERLGDAARADRMADGPALVGDLRVIRGAAPFDITALRVPVVFGRGGPASGTHHREGTAWLAANVPGATLVEIGAATHGAHLSHPDHFAALVRTTVERGNANRSNCSNRSQAATGSNRSADDAVLL